MAVTRPSRFARAEVIDRDARAAVIVEAEEVVNNAVFEAEGAEEMVLVKDIELYSMCEHHLMPFEGKASVAYLPAGQVVGISKLARVVDAYAHRPRRNRDLVFRHQNDGIRLPVQHFQAAINRLLGVRVA